MATVKLKFRPSTLDGKEGKLYYQIIHRRVARQISTGCGIMPSEWDSGTSAVVVPDGDTDRAAYIRDVTGRVKAVGDHIRRVIDRFERQRVPYTADMVAGICSRTDNSTCFFSFVEGVIDRLCRLGHNRTGETYAVTLSRFSRFRAAGTVMLEEIDSDLMLEYEAYLRSEGLCRNTSSFYMRNMRALYNRAVEQGLVDQRHPFRHVYTGIGQTIKRAVPLTTIRRIKQLDLTDKPGLELARDMFLFSFLMRGMSFVDMAYLKKTDLRGDTLVYRRKKTRRQLTIKWEKPMQSIVDKYDTTGTPYMLPIIMRDDGTELRQYRNKAHLLNTRLKQIGRSLALPMPLTMYVARHAWASIARSMNVSVSIISEAMGHDSESTTRIYLASLDTAVVDKANRMILSSL